MNNNLNELRKKPHWTFSSLNSFINICSLQWAFKYIYQVEPESTPVNLLFGSAFHHAAEWLSISRMKNKSSKVSEVQEVFSEEWLSQVRSAENVSLTNQEYEKLNETGCKMIACLNREWTERNILAVSKAFSVYLPGASKPLIGEIDCIVQEEDGKHTLIDWKTSARKWPSDKAEKDLQATCFMYGYENSVPEYNATNNHFRYDVITKTKEPSYTQHCTKRTEDDFLRLSQLVRTVEKAVGAEVFLPNEQSFYCSGCQFASACKEWHRKQAKIMYLPTMSAA